MTMFMNLHTLPRGQHMYTAWITYDPIGEVRGADEIDFVASSQADVATLMAVVSGTEDYKTGYPDARIVAIADQSTGDKVYVEGGLATN